MQIAFKQSSKQVEQKLSFWDKVKAYFKRPSNSFYYFLFMVALGIIFFCASLFTNYFTTPFGGDYTSQEIPFYTHGYDTWWRFFTTGEFALYDTNTFLGVNNIGSNSFYYLFDPFFFPILLCPRDYIAQGMAFLTIFKIAFAGLFFHFYLKYIGVKRPIAKIAGLAYAFCGWMAWYLWFNHMTEVVTVFPLMLWGVEKVLKEKKPWLLAFSIFLMGITNYYFCISMTMCTFLYAIFRYFQGLPKHSAKENLKIIGMGVVGFGIGCAVACVILLPTCLYALGTSRGTSSYLGDLGSAIKNGEWGTFFNLIFSWEKVDYYYYGNTYRTVYPVIEFIFPPATCRNIPLIRFGDDSYEPEACSLFVYIPIMIFFVPALIKSVRQKHFSPLIGTAIMILMLMTPFSYYMLHGFSQPYSRWTLFASSSLIAYVALYLNNIKEEPKWMVFVGAASLIALVVVGALLGQSMLDAGKLSSGTIINPRLPILPVALVEGFYILAVSIVIFLILKFKKKWITQTLTTFTCLEICLVGVFVIEGHGVVDYNGVNNGWGNNIALSALTKEINAKDKSYFRSYSSLATSGAENDGMRNNYNGLTFFHSLYNFNVDDFTSWIDMKDRGGWGGSYVQKRGNLDAFLGIKYYMIQKSKVKRTDEEDKPYTVDNYHQNVPYGYIDVSNEFPNSTFNVYKNLDHVDFAFSFDTYYETSTHSSNQHLFNASNSLAREEKFIQSAILNEEQVELVKEKYPHLQSKGDRAVIEAQRVNSSNLDYTFYDIFNRKDNEAGDKQTYGPWLSSEELLSLNPDNVIFPSQKTTPDDDNEHWGRYVQVITPKKNDLGEIIEDFPYDKDGMALYLGFGYSSNNEKDTDIYLVDENNKIICWDDHSDSELWYIQGIYRGFYSSPTYTNGKSNGDAPKISKIILCPRNKKTLKPTEFYFDSYTSYRSKLDIQKEYPVYDVNYRLNNISFKTNFEQNRIIVTQLPYEKGWTVKATVDGKVTELETFAAQGGFTAFISTTGLTSYEMNFYTPYLRMGSLISVAGGVCFFATLLGYYYISYKRKPEDLQEMLRN